MQFYTRLKRSAQRARLGLCRLYRYKEQISQKSSFSIIPGDIYKILKTSTETLRQVFRPFQPPTLSSDGFHRRTNLPRISAFSEFLPKKNSLKNPLVRDPPSPPN